MVAVAEASNPKQVVRLFATKEQMEVINCRARLMGLFACRRWGKTDTFLNRCIKRVLEEPIEYLYVSPDYGLAKEQYRRVASVLDSRIVRAVEQPKPTIELGNGSRIHFRSFDDPKRLKGLRRIAEIWVDEIQDIPEDEFWRILRPMISDVRGTLIVSGQFRGQNWHYHKFFMAGQQPNQSYAKSWRFPWQTGLIYQTDGGREEVEAARRDLTKIQFDEMYECLPVANILAVFQTDDLQAISKGQTQTHAEPGHRYIISYDLGEHNDPSALGVWDIDAPEKPTLVHAEDIPLRTKHHIQADALRGKQRQWNSAAVVIDGTAGGTGGRRSADENIKFYRDRIPSVHVMIWEPSVKAELVRKTVQAIEQHQIFIPATLGQVHTQLSIYEGRRKGDGWEYSAPKNQPGARDDQVAQVMMGIWAIKAGWAPSDGRSRIGAFL